MRHSTSVVALLAAIAITAPLASQCTTPNGLALGFSGGRLGDAFSISLSGTPGVSGLLGVDTAAGPVSTPIGLVCLGMSPALTLLPFTLDSLGTYTLSGVVPADGSLNGFAAHLQAGATDTAQPGGFALSNGVTAKLRSPKLFFIEMGLCSNSQQIGGRWCGYDALNEAVYTAGIPLPSCVRDAALVPDLGWIAFLVGTGHLICFDTTTGAQTLDVSLVTWPCIPMRMCVDGTTVYLICPGNPYNPTLTPGAIRALSLPSGTPGVYVPLSGVSPDALMMMGGGFAYARTGASITMIDLVNGVQAWSVPFGSTAGFIDQWLRVGNRLYCLMPGANGFILGPPASPPLLNAIDLTTHTALYATPVPVAPIGPATMMRHGPGNGANELFVYVQGIAQPLVRVDATTLQPLGALTMPATLKELTLSAGGTEWISHCGNSACQLSVLQPPVLSPIAIAALPHLQDTVELLVAVPSTTLRKAYTVFKDHGSSFYFAVPLLTDPTVVPTWGVGLPIGSAGIPWRCLVD